MAISTAIDPTRAASTVGIQTQYKNLAAGGAFLPIRVALLGQGATASTYSLNKRQVFSSYEVGNVYGFGSPLHLAAINLLPENGDGIGAIPLTVYPLEDNVAGVAATATITPVIGVITQSIAFRVNISNVLSEYFVVEVGDLLADVTAKVTAAINAVPAMPFTAADGATVVNLTSKWKGKSANDAVVSVEGDTGSGMTWTLVQPASGDVNPTVDSALAQMGSVWEVFVVNCLNIDDDTALNTLQTVGEGRRLPETNIPYVTVTGTPQDTVSNAITIPEARKTDRVNGQVPCPDSDDLPFVIAARSVARMAKVAQFNPPVNYNGQRATGLTPGADSAQWTSSEMDAAVKAGSSTIVVKDGIVELEDMVTFYHPTGNPLPEYRYYRDQICLFQALYQTKLIFEAQEWRGAPLIPDDQPTRNSAAKKPKMAKAAVAKMIDNLALDAIISDPDFSKASIVAGINETNPKRLDISFTIKLSGTTNIISIDLNFAFYFGVTQLAA